MSNETKHTPEPWVAEPPDAPHNDGGTHWEIHDCYGRTATVYGELDDPETEENARRIVACVNACAGISTADLEADALVSMAQESAKLDTQRDELAAALRKIADGAVMDQSTMFTHADVVLAYQELARKALA